MLSWHRFFIALVGVVASAAMAQEAVAPILQIDPGAHWAPVRRIAVSPDQRLIATASDDKTVRVWLRETRSLLQVLRPAIGNGTDGRLYGVAFHPTQSIVAVGGSSREGNGRIHLFQPETGESLRAWSPAAGEVKRLVWSPDGRWLVAAFAAPGGVRVYSPEGHETARVSLRGDAYGLDINANSTVAATDVSGAIRLFRLSTEGRIEQIADVTRVGEPIAAAFSPDGSRLAVVGFASDRNGIVDILSAADGRPLDSLGAAAPVGRGRTQAVSWSASGNRLIVGGARTTSTASARDAIDTFRGYVREFEVTTRTPRAAIDVSADAVTDLARLADEGHTYASFDSTWGTLGADGRRDATPARSDYVRRADRLRVTPDGMSVQWQTGSHAQPQSFDLGSRYVRQGGIPDAATADVPGPSSGTRDWESIATQRPTILGSAMDLAPGEISRAVARIPGSDDVAWGTGHRLTRIGPGGRVAWRIAPGTETRAVNVTRDGRRIVCAMSDGTIRWYRARDGALLLSLFSTADSRWVLWSPRGYYDASAGSEHLIGWHVNGAAEAASEFFSIGRFRDRLHRPDVIDRLLIDGDEPLAQQTADRLRAEAMVVAAAPASPQQLVVPTPPAQVPDPTAPASPATEPAAEPATPTPITPPTAPQTAPPTALPAPAPSPSIVVASPDILAALPPTLVYRQPPKLLIRSAKVELKFGIVQRTGDAITSLLVRRNGILQEIPAPTFPAVLDGKSPITVIVEVPEGDSVVHIVAANVHGYSDALSFAISRPAAPAPTPSAQTAPAAPPKPRLFALVIGVGRYADSRVNTLNLPAKDAEDFAAVLGTQSGKAYASVETRVLTNRDATKDAIAKGLAWLSSSVGERDLGFLFIAGHAVNHPNGSYYFLTHDTAVGQIPTTSVAEGTIRSALVRLKGRAVLFVDTCHAGNAFGSAKGFSRDMSKIINDLASPENGVIVFASSTGRQDSLEKKEWGNGAFTKALIAGLRGGADLMKRGRVTFQGLGYYVSGEVEKLTRGEQTPVLISPPPGLPDFTLAVMASES